MTNKERWKNWALVMAGGRTYLGKINNMTEDESGEESPRNIIMQPCIQVIEQFPVVPGQGNRPVIMPVASFATIGMMGTDDVMVALWADACVNLGNCKEEELQPYTEAYDQMLDQAKRNAEASRLQKAAITVPTAEDIARVGQGGGGAKHH